MHLIKTKLILVLLLAALNGTFQASLWQKDAKTEKLALPRNACTTAFVGAYGRTHQNRTRRQSRLLNTPNVDHFETTKMIIKNSPFTMPDWNHKIYKTKYELRNRTNCGHSARYIIELLTDVKDLNQHINEAAAGFCSCSMCHFFPGSHTLPEFSTPDESFCSLENFLKKTDHYYDNEVAQKLLTCAENKVHQFFYISLNYGNHIFVIEKISDGFQTWWRIYQSWFKHFTLNEWLGNDKWDLNNARGFDINFQRYGKGQELGSLDIQNCLKDYVGAIIKLHLKDGPSAPNEKTMPIYVRMFNAQQE